MKKRAPKFWTEEKEAELRQLYPNHTSAEVAQIMRISRNSVESRVIVLGLQKCIKPAEWTQEENRLLAVLFPVTDNAVLAERFGRSVYAVAQHARALGVYKPRRGRFSGPLVGQPPRDDFDEPNAVFATEELRLGHVRIRFGRNAPHNHALTANAGPRTGRSSLERLA